MHAVFAPVTSSMKFIRTMLPTFNDIANDLNNELARLTTPTTEFPRLLTDMITESEFYFVMDIMTSHIFTQSAKSVITFYYFLCSLVFERFWHQNGCNWREAWRTW